MWLRLTEGRFVRSRSGADPRCGGLRHVGNVMLCRVSHVLVHMLPIELDDAGSLLCDSKETALLVR